MMLQTTVNLTKEKNKAVLKIRLLAACLVSLFSWHINICGLFMVKVNPGEKWYLVTYSWGINGFIPFQRVSGTGFELACNDGRVQHVTHNATGTLLDCLYQHALGVVENAWIRILLYSHPFTNHPHLILSLYFNVVFNDISILWCSG